MSQKTERSSIVITGGAGDDLLSGDRGNDTLTGGDLRCIHNSLELSHRRKPSSPSLTSTSSVHRFSLTKEKESRRKTKVFKVPRPCEGKGFRERGEPGFG
ncbi:MAG: calcium-binding protein [Oscillatoriales cyanobacterium]|nr:MAG: calcium-binding protein [Oscillatoriales cyanobacterium]